MPAVQGLATLSGLTSLAQASNPSPQLTIGHGTGTIPAVQSVGAAQSPRPMTGTGTLTFTGTGTAATTMRGIATSYAALPLRAAGVAYSGSYSPFKVGGYAATGLNGTPVTIQGPRSRIQIALADLGMPTVMATGTGWQSPPIDNLGFLHVTFALASTQVVTLQLNRFADTQGAASIGTQVTATAVANTSLALDSSDGKGFAAFTLGLTNGSGSTATLSSYALLMMSA